MKVGYNINALKNSEKGASLLEYALMAALVSVVAVSALTFLGQRSQVTFNVATCRICVANDPVFSQWDEATTAFVCSDSNGAEDLMARIEQFC